MNLKKLANFENWLDEIDAYSTVQYQLDIVSDYRAFLSEHNNNFTLEMYRKLEQIVKQVRLNKVS